MSGIGLIQAGYSSPNIVGASGGGGIAYAYSVNTYADLPASPVDGLVIKVIAETDIQPSYLRWSDSGSTWYLVLGFIINVAQLPAESINLSPPVSLGGSGNIIVSNNEIAYSWNGASWVALDPTPIAPNITNSIIGVNIGEIILTSLPPGQTSPITVP